MDRLWIADEIQLFEDAIITHGGELRAVRDHVVTRSLPEVVRFYGHWKKYYSSIPHQRLFLTLLVSVRGSGKNTIGSGS